MVATALNPLTELFSQSYCSHVGIRDVVKAPVKTGMVEEVDVAANFHHKMVKQGGLRN